VNRLEDDVSLGIVDCAVTGQDQNAICLLARSAERLNDSQWVLPPIKPRNLGYQRAIRRNSIMPQAPVDLRIGQFTVLWGEGIDGWGDDALFNTQVFSILRQGENRCVIAINESAQIIPYRRVG
jgi:hypothetical protein